MAPMARTAGRTAVLNVVKTAPQAGTDVAKIKETLPHKQMARHLEHIAQRGKGHKKGNYDRINDSLRSYFFQQNITKAASGEPFILSYSLGFGVDMQIVLSTEHALMNHTRHGLDNGVSDSRWTGGSDTKTCHTAIHCRNDEGRCLPTAASLSSGESAATLSVMLAAIEDCRPCGLLCTHPIVIKDESETTTTFIRQCPAKVKASPTCNIDKDSK
jgi:hypothetical protein